MTRRAGIVARLVAAALIVWTHPSHAAEVRRPGKAEKAAHAAGDAFARGAFAEAADGWRLAEREFRRAGEVDGQIEALLQQAAACRALGQTKLAMEVLHQAEEVAKTSGKPRHLARVKAATGAAQTFGSRKEDPEKALREALSMARAAKDNALEARVLNDLGILLGGRDGGREARTMFEQSATLARAAGEPALAAKARRNLAGAALAARDFAGAEREARSAAKAAEDLPPSHDRASQRLLCGFVEDK